MKKNHILITSLGNTLEWFDFGLFIFLAPIVGEKFFPAQNPTTATLAALTVFAVGFICRPLGGILFGRRGDMHGRANALRLSIITITIPTLLIGVLPSYNSIGIAAPILFTVLRLAQGISVGGEYSGVMIYLAESAPIKRRGFITSFAAVGANVGFLWATLVLMLLNLFFSEQEISAWAWRLPFVVVGLPGSLILYFRFRLAESPTFSYLQSAHKLEKRPFQAAIRGAPRQLLKIFCLTCMSSTIYYIFFGYMPNHFKAQMHPAADGKIPLLIQSVSLFLMIFLVPFAGLCGDYFGRRRMLMVTAVGIIVFAVPGFYLLESGSLSGLILSFSFATILSSFDQGNTLCAAVENCPANVRYSGIAFSYNLGMAIFGGTAPFVVTVLSQEIDFIAPGFYLMIMAGISLLAATTLLSPSAAPIEQVIRLRDNPGSHGSSSKISS